MSLTDLKKNVSNKSSLLIPLFFVAIIFVTINLLSCNFNHNLKITTWNVFFHQLTTIVIVLISWSIFIFSYYTYPLVKDVRVLIAGFTFFTVGLLEGVALFYSLLCDQQIMLIWVISQLFILLGFGFLVLIKDTSRYIRRRYPALIAISAVIISILFIVFIPAKYIRIIENNSISALGIIIILSIVILYTYGLYRSMIKYKETGMNYFKKLSYAFFTMAYSQVTMFYISQMYDVVSLLSKVYQLIAYVLFFYIFYVKNVKKPFIMLSKTQNELNEYVTELDKLVEKRTTELRCINEKLLADQEIARVMQMSMLPASLPQDEYVRFSSGYLPADKLSGDFYNIFKIDDVHFGICIGDVSGHGVSAAMLSIFTFQKMQSLMEETGGDGMVIPSMVLKHIYESYNSGNFNDTMYIVMLYGVFNTQTGIFSYASGGLNTTPLRIRPDGSIQELDNDGFAICKLGDLLKPKFVNHQILLFPGDKLVLYTDGLIDARNKSRETYTLNRLKNTILDHYKWGVEHLCEAMVKDVNAFTEEKPADDITVIAMDVLPPF